MFRQILSTTAVAGVLIAAIGSGTVAQAANPCAAKKPAAAKPAKNPKADESPSAAPKSAVSSESARSNVVAAGQPPPGLMRNRTGEIIQTQ